MGSFVPVGNTVDPETGTHTNTIGRAQITAKFRDPDIDPLVSAFYYILVLEIPTPLYSLYDALALGKDPTKIKELGIIERHQIKIFGEFLAKLRATKEGGSTLLDLTMILIGSNLGNASSHNNRNLPILLAGGGFRHGQHLAFDAKNNYPLTNLFVSMLQRMGIEADSFSTGKSTMKGLDLA